MSKEIQDHIVELYQVRDFLGSGAYGHVWKVKSKKNSKIYALKKIYDAFQNNVDAQRTYRQITILHELDHPNIVKLHEVIKSKNMKDLYLVFEYMESDMHSLLGQNVLQPVHLKFIICQLAQVIKYLHSAHLIHRDLKSSNILINSNCQIKLADFGLVRSLTTEEGSPLILSEDVATRWYRSPEMLINESEYGKPTDIWSLGCILAQLLTGDPIFKGSSVADQLHKILELTGKPSKEGLQQLSSPQIFAFFNEVNIKKRKLDSYFDSQTAPQLLDLLLRMLEFSPSKRITIDQILELQFLQEFKSKSTNNEKCQKFIVPDIDDNVRLSIEQYRKKVYQDIERRYPQVNKFILLPRMKRCYNSQKKINKYILPRRINATHSLFKKSDIVDNDNDYHFNDLLNENKKSKGNHHMNKSIEKIQSLTNTYMKHLNNTPNEYKSAQTSIHRRKLKKKDFWNQKQNI